MIAYFCSVTLFDLEIMRPNAVHVRIYIAPVRAQAAERSAMHGTVVMVPGSRRTTVRHL